MTTPNQPKPAFTEIMQIAICVRDLDATIRHYEDDFGIGPWTRWDTSPESFPEQYEHGQRSQTSTRCAAVYIGSVMLEVFQPVSEDSIFTQFLEEKGEGVHHIGVRAVDYDTLIANQAKRGNTFPLQGHIDGIDVTYLPTDRTLGVLLEVFKAPEGHALNN
jgi:methylmalonyl-CoA/ethylmalonyl-CoA epimerase